MDELTDVYFCVCSSGDVGIHAIFTMDGTPPFLVHYTTTDRKGTTQSQERYLGARGELKLQPNKSGTYTYSFDAISDAHYSRVPMEGAGRTVTQVVHPLASAKFKDASVDVCGDNPEIEVALQLEGVSPWKVEMQIGSEVMKFEGLKKEVERVKVTIPKDAYARGGQVGLDLGELTATFVCMKENCLFLRTSLRGGRKWMQEDVESDPDERRGQARQGKL